MKRRTSFYLPKDTAKHLHISSQTRVREVIEALLNKFTVVDNPAKFALFERTEGQSQGNPVLFYWPTQQQYLILKWWLLSPLVYMRKLSDDECPLYLRLCAGPSEKALSLVLKENETGDVNVSSALNTCQSAKCVNIFFKSQNSVYEFITTVETISLLYSGMHLAFLSCATFCEFCSARKKSMSGRLWSAMLLLKKKWSRLWPGLLTLVESSPMKS